MTATDNKEPFIIPRWLVTALLMLSLKNSVIQTLGCPVPMDAEIKLFDGQHRAAGISQFCKDTI
ncbi:hypothetical protein [Citrobacter amalonaticus]|uniref:hypothetical protein n=1 Tax=Citrobacter amalonaticus TaxID=35703 RepID=UPI003456C161